MECPGCHTPFEFTFKKYFQRKPECDHCGIRLQRSWKPLDEFCFYFILVFTWNLIHSFAFFGAYYSIFEKYDWMEKSSLPYWCFGIAAGLFILFVVLNYYFIRYRTFYTLYKGAGFAWRQFLKKCPLGILIAIVALGISFPLAMAWGPNKDTSLSFFSMCPEERLFGEEISTSICKAGARLALAMGANPDYTNFFMKESPLGVALIMENHEMIDLLLDAGADVMHVYGDHRKMTPMEYGVQGQRHFDQFVKLAGGPHVLLPPRNENLLVPAVLFGKAPDYNREVILKLMDYGLDINEPSGTYWDISPFFIACFRFDAETIEALIKKGADVKKIGEGNITPAHWAATNKDPDVMRVLIRHGAPVNVISDCGMTPLMKARKEGNKEVIKILEQHLGQMASLHEPVEGGTTKKGCKG